MSEVKNLKTPPYSLESEQALLGGLMMDNRIFDEVADMINTNDFYLAKNQIIFGAIADLINHNEPADIITINTYLSERGQLNNSGGFDYLTTININAPSASNAKAYALQIREESIKRALLNGSVDIINRVHQKDGTLSNDILDFAEQQIFAISEKAAKKNANIHIKEGLKTVIKNAQHAAEHGIQSVKTDFGALDELTAGFHRGDLIIIAGRPAMGKTAFAMNIVENIALGTQKKPVAVFSLEMSTEQIITRMVSAHGHINAQKIRRGEMDDRDWNNFNNAAEKLNKGDIIIDETASITPLEIRAKCRRIKREYPDLALVMIDYLQLMNKASSRITTSENRNQEISQISRSLKALARELNIPIIVLSQLNRAVEGREKANKGRMPQMADLRDSGAIEQDADMIIFIYRDEVYHDKNPEDARTEDKNNKIKAYFNQSEIGMADIKLAKNRNGPIGTVRLGFNKKFAKFGLPPPSSYKDQDPNHERANDALMNQEANFAADEDDISHDDLQNTKKALENEGFDPLY